MKHTVVLVLSYSKNPQSCVPPGESEFAVFPCEKTIGRVLLHSSDVITFGF